MMYVIYLKIPTKVQKFPLQKVHFTQEEVNKVSHSYENSCKTLYYCFEQEYSTNGKPGEIDAIRVVMGTISKNPYSIPIRLQ